MADDIARTVAWLNENDGVVGAATFVLALLIGWAAGVFQALRHRPDFRIEVKPGPSLATVVPSFETSGRDTGRVAIALYLDVANVGRAASHLDRISIAYRSEMLKWQNAGWWQRFSHLEDRIEHIRRIYRWLPIEGMTVSLEPFARSLTNKQSKAYPFLVQAPHDNVGEHQSLFLEVGAAVTGVVYFESAEYFGGARPRPVSNDCRDLELIVTIADVFGGTHRKRATVPLVSMDEARKWCPSFGTTSIAMGELHDEDDDGSE
jgi:hypothetical protein